MNLQTMPRKEIEKTVVSLYNSYMERVVIVLDNCESLVGDIRKKAIRSDGVYVSASEACFSVPDTLELEYNHPREHSIFVPVDRITGIAEFHYEQDLSYDPAEWGKPREIGDSFYRILCSESLERAKRNGFLVEYHEYDSVYSLFEEPVTIRWGGITFTQDTPLYCGWEYLVRKSGGINSLGFGFGLSIYLLAGQKACGTLSEIKSKRHFLRGKICVVVTKQQSWALLIF